MSELTFRFWPATRRLHIALDERESPLQVALQQALEDEARRLAACVGGEPEGDL